MILQDLFNKTDWSLLRQQKAQLLDMTNRPDINTTPEEQLALEGIISLLNDYQDTAVECMGFTEERVFGLQNDNNG